MIRLLLVVLAVVLFLGAGFVSAGDLWGWNPHTLTYFGLAALALGLTPQP